MKFLVQHNLIATVTLEQLKEVVKNFPHEFVGLIPFSREITSDEPLTGTKYIPYGSTLFTTLALTAGWEGLHFNPSTFNYRASTQNRPDMLNSEMIMTVKDASVFLQNCDDGEDWFIRPSEDLKHFSGQVIKAGECAAWLNDAMSLPPESGTYAMSPDLEVVISTPRNINAEWRWFIVDGKIVNGSMYRCHGQLIKNPEHDKAVINEAQALADIWLPDSCVVMDTALVDDTLYVIEFNCINSSGFYGHNVGEIFTALYQFHA